MTPTQIIAHLSTPSTFYTSNVFLLSTNPQPFCPLLFTAEGRLRPNKKPIHLFKRYPGHALASEPLSAMFAHLIPSLPLSTLPPAFPRPLNSFDTLEVPATPFVFKATPQVGPLPTPPLSLQFHFTPAPSTPGSLRTSTAPRWQTSAGLCSHVLLHVQDLLQSKQVPALTLPLSKVLDKDIWHLVLLALKQHSYPNQPFPKKPGSAP